MLWCSSKWSSFFSTFLSQPEILHIPLYSRPTLTALGTGLLGFLSLTGVNPICYKLVSNGRISPEMCWGEWGAPPQWHVTGQQEEALRLWLPGFHALSWDFSRAGFCPGVRIWRGAGEPGLTGAPLLAPSRVWLQWGPCLSGGKVGVLGVWNLHETSWHIHGMWRHLWHLGMTWSLSLCPGGGNSDLPAGKRRSEESSCRKSLFLLH